MTAPESDTQPLLAIARLGAPRGVGGFLRIHSYSGEFAHIVALAEVMAAPPGGKPKTLTVTGKEEGPWGLAMRFRGYESPEAARALTGLDILAPRAQASALAEGEWYVADLVGMDLVCEGRVVARIAGVLDGAADPLLECVLPEGRTALVPFRKEFVGEVDTAARRMQLIHGWILE